MTTTVQERIVAAIVSGLGDIRQANGYRTDIGAAVLLGVVKNDPDSIPFTAVLPQVEEAETGKYGVSVCTMPVRLEAFVELASGDDNPTVAATAVLADLKECMGAVTWTEPFESGEEFEVGDTVTGEDSGATGLVTGVSVTSGAFETADAAGTLTLRRVTGEFAAAEDLSVDSIVVATAAGAATGQHAVARMTGGLADSIGYTGGGQDDFPGLEDPIVGVSAEFDIAYKTVAGDPYHQP